MLGDQEFLCGDLSVADIATFMNIHHGLRLGAPLFTKTENVGLWYARLKARPSFAKVVAEMAEADVLLSNLIPGSTA